MIARLFFVLRLTPMPVVEPLAQKASSNGTQVQVLSGAVIFWPTAPPPVPAPPVPVAAKEADAEEAPPLPVVVVFEAPPQAVRPRVARSEKIGAPFTPRSISRPGRRRLGAARGDRAFGSRRP